MAERAVGLDELRDCLDGSTLSTAYSRLARLREAVVNGAVAAMLGDKLSEDVYDAEKDRKPLDDFGDLTQKVVVLREGMMNRAESEHPLFVRGGSGTMPRYDSNAGSKILGVCASPAATRRSRVGSSSRASSSQRS